MKTVFLEWLLPVVVSALVGACVIFVADNNIYTGAWAGVFLMVGFKVGKAARQYYEEHFKR